MKSQFLLVVLMLVCCCGVVLSETQQNQNTKVGREVKDDGTNTYGDCTPHIHVRAGPYNMHPDGKTKKDDDGYASDFNPMQMKSLYNMPDNLSAGAGSVIAIIDAYAHANAESDLNVFASEYGLPACTTANGCFKRVNQAGGTTYTTATSSGWNQEVSLDLQWAHAIAPGAKKILVEANSASMGDLMAAVQYASTVADYVSMSFGASETNYKGYESVFQTPGVSYFASTGDNGEAVNYPGVSPNVIAVGGTTLYVDDATQAFADERGWSGSGGGCSLYFQATTLQKPFSDTVCPPGQRGVPDVSYNADPDSGVAIYVSDDCTTAPNCWYSVGGTSLAAPMMAARAAVNGSIVDATFVYGNNLIYRDIITGDNGYNCSVGYDLVTGLGSWINDVGATPFTTTTTGSSTTGASTTTGSNQGSTPTPIGKSDTTFSTNTPFVASANSVHFSFSLLIIAVLAILSIL